MKPTPDLLPCPFCGSTNLKTGGDDKVVGVWCLTCQAAGPNHYGSREWNDRALSVPAAAVVGEPEPIGYCSEYGLDKLASQAHHYCLSVSKAQENEFQFPIYASRISQQDAELERLRRELADMTISRDGYAKQAMAREAEGRRKAFIEAAEVVSQYASDFGQRTEHDNDGARTDLVCSDLLAALRAKAEETRT